MANPYEILAQLVDQGGVIMWVLLAMSIVSVVLSVERFCFFWFSTNRSRQLRVVDQLGQVLRRGDLTTARKLVQNDDSVYGRFVLQAIDEPGSEAAAAQAIEDQRPRLERFMPTLSTIITAAPMLGILGTVVGLIGALNVFSAEQAVTDPRLVSPAIAKALITTAAGLVVAILALFPYNSFRAQLNRTIGRLEALAAATEQGLAIKSNSSDKNQTSG